MRESFHLKDHPLLISHLNFVFFASVAPLLTQALIPDFLFRCSEALELLKPIVTQYRKDGWKILLKAALHLALKCAFLEAAIPDYVAFGLELAANESAEEPEEKHRIMTNICRLLEAPAKLPSAEPGLTYFHTF